jgi:hypothetical protein
VVPGDMAVCIDARPHSRQAQCEMSGFKHMCCADCSQLAKLCSEYIYQKQAAGGRLHKHPCVPASEAQSLTPHTAALA